MVANRANRPKINPNPIAINPQTFKKSTIETIDRLVAIALNINANQPWESDKNANELQFGLTSLITPSYRQYHPIKTRAITNPVN